MITAEMQTSPLFIDWLRKEKLTYLITGLTAFGLGVYQVIFVPNVSVLNLLFTLVCIIGGVYFCSLALREKLIIARMSTYEPDKLRLRAIAAFALGIFATILAFTYPTSSIRVMQIIFGLLFLLLGILALWRKSRLNQLIESTNPSETPV
jgi:uncharacterized membrane protein HdeD (DUF308 family)